MESHFLNYVFRIREYNLVCFLHCLLLFSIHKVTTLIIHNPLMINFSWSLVVISNSSFEPLIPDLLTRQACNQWFSEIINILYQLTSVSQNQEISVACKNMHLFYPYAWLWGGVRGCAAVGWAEGAAAVRSRLCMLRDLRFDLEW